MKLKVGNTVSYTHSNGYIGAAVIESIEICSPGDKYGRVATQCDTNNAIEGVVCLSDHHWCYFDQINEVLS